MMIRHLNNLKKPHRLIAWKSALSIGAFAGVSLVLASCISSGGGGGGTIAEGGIGGSGISQGPVSGFGSVFVTGIEHFLDTATITVNGASSVDADLKLGMVLRIVGSVDSVAGTGTASDVSYDQNLEGPVDTIDVANNTMVVLGQTVLIDSLTVFDGLSVLSDLVVGDVVEISGLVDGLFVIHATRIDVEADTGAYELSGTITNLNLGALTFDIGAQTVDYSSTLMLDVPGGVPANGLFVRVEGTRPGGVGTALVVTSAEAEDPSPNATIGEDLEVDGFISNFISSVQFDVAGQPVRTSGSTTFEHGVVGDLGNGVRIEVEGNIAPDGVLDADEVSFKSETSVRGEAGEVSIEADIEAVNVSAGTITVLGLIIELNSSTQLEDERDEMQPFSISDLVVGDRVDVEAFEDETGDLIAESLHRKEAKAGVELEGPVGSVDTLLKTLTIAGVTAITDLSTVYQNETDTVISSAAFFVAAQVPGQSVDVEGVLTGSTILASEMKLED